LRADVSHMLDSGAAVAEPDDARLLAGERRKLRAADEPSGQLPGLLDTRHVRLELTRLRAPAGAASGSRRGRTASPGPVGRDG
jgi:hypothetical protein